MDDASGEVHVHVINEPGRPLICPVCGGWTTLYDHVPVRRWRHLDTCQMLTIIECSVPRVKCDKDGIQQPKVPWADPHSRFTQLFEMRSIDAMLMCPRRKASELMGASEDSLGRIAIRAVARGLERKVSARQDGAHPFPVHLSIDEKFWRGRNCATIIGDPEAGIVEEMIPGNQKEPIKSWLQAIPETERQSIASVSMDFHRPFRSAVEATVPNAKSKIVFDKFHLVKMVNDAMEETRRKEMARHQQADKEFAMILKKSRYSLLRRGDRLKPGQQEKIDTVDEWFHETGDAYRMKESIRQILSGALAEEVEVLLREWIDWVQKERLEPMKRVARLIGRSMFGILNIFRLKRSNANAESLNARIQAVRVKSRGHRSYESFKRDVFFHLGGLDLYPAVSG
jgi:transposase